MREIIIDTETTGLDYRAGDRIIEVGCVELINYVPTGDNLQFYCSTNKVVSQEAYKISGKFVTLYYVFFTSITFTSYKWKYDL